MQSEVHSILASADARHSSLASLASGPATHPFDTPLQRTLSEELAAANAALSDLYDNAPCGYHSLDAQGRFVRINNTELDWLGCSREDVLGRLCPADFFTDAGRAAFRLHFPRLLAGASIDKLELELVGRHGQRRWVSLSATAAQDGDGRFSCSRSVMHDIIELHAAREALRALNIEQSAMLDNPLVALARVRDRRFTWVNRGMTALFGYAADEMLGRSTAMLYADPDDHARIGAAVRSLRSPTGQRFRREMLLLHKNGRPLHIDMNSVLLSETSGESMGIFVDISAMKSAEASRLRAAALDAENTTLRETHRLKDQFLAHMSHELRTPLNAVIGLSGLLGSGAVPPSSPRFAPLLAQIGTSGQDLLRLVEAMLVLADHDAGRIALWPVPLDLRDAVDSALSLQRAAIERRRLRVQVALEATLPAVLLDPLRFEQVLVALLDNAVKFSPEGAVVDLRLARDGDGHFTLDVEDRGPGIAASDLRHLFTAFHQLSQGRTRTHEGAGLGLALVRRLVELQGGAVQVRSTPGTGSVFTVRLPLVPPGDLRTAS